jgi:DNA-binding IclR family transcriptional regulator
MLSSVSRVGRVLDLFTPGSPEWGASGVAHELGIAKSSAHALLVTLDDIGLVRRLTDGRYRLGWRIAELNRALRASTELGTEQRARLQRVADDLDAVLHIASTRIGELVYLDRIVGRRVRLPVDPGTGEAAHRAALRRVLLAPSDCAERDAAAGPRDLTVNCSVAAPIRSRKGEVDAALSLTIATAATVVTRRRLEAVVQTLAEEIARARRAEPDLRGVC